MFTFVKPTPDLGATRFWPATVEDALLIPEVAVLGEDVLKLVYPIDTYIDAFTVTKLKHAASLVDDPRNFGEFGADAAGQAIRGKYLVIAYKQELAEISAELAALVSTELSALPEYIGVVVECATLPIVEELLVQGIVVAAVSLERNDEQITFYMVLGTVKE